MEKQNKTVIINNGVCVWYDQCPISFVHILNAVWASPTVKNLQEAMLDVARTTEADKFFVWGYENDTFWLKQRIEYMGDELEETNTLIVKFEE